MGVLHIRSVHVHPRESRDLSRTRKHARVLDAKIWIDHGRVTMMPLEDHAWVSELTISRRETEALVAPPTSRSPALSSGECCGFRLQQDLIKYFQTTAQKSPKYNEVTRHGNRGRVHVVFRERTHRECACACLSMRPEGGADWVRLLGYCGYGMNTDLFEKVSHGGRVLRNASAMTAEREALRMGIEHLTVLFR